MKPLTKSESAGVRRALAAKDFDEALRLTPESVLERLLDQPGARESRDLFDTDMFPNGVPKPLTPKERARLDADAER